MKRVLAILLLLTLVAASGFTVVAFLFGGEEPRPRALQTATEGRPYMGPARAFRSFAAVQSDLDSFRLFVNEIQAVSYYSKWGNQNPGELARWQTYRDQTAGGQAAAPPSMLTHFGAALVYAALEAAPEVATTSTSTPTASTTTSATSTAPTSTSTSTSTSATTTVPAPSVGFGISDGADIVYEADATRIRELDSMRAAGAKWARFDFAWSVIEGSPGGFNVAYLDTAVREAEARGMSVLATIDYAPAWANGGRSDDKYAPLDPADYGRIAGRIAAHFAPLGVHAYELWNEPNISVFWKPTPDVAAYSALVKAAYPAIHAADPSAIVLAGVASPHGAYRDTNCDGVADTGRDATGYDPLDFLEGMYASGAGGSFDALSHHPYEGAGFIVHPCSAWRQMQDTSPSLRSIMAAHGDGAKRIWATEYGNQVPAWTDEAGQATRIAQAMTLWKGYPWAGVLFAFNLWDVHGDVFGMLRPDFSQRPALGAYKAAAG